MWDFDVHNILRKGSAVELNIFGGKQPLAAKWEFTPMDTKILGTLYQPSGPREWSPSSELPEGFSSLMEVLRTTRIWIKIDQIVTAEGMRLWKAGYLGLLVPTSSFWDHYKKRFGL